MKKYYTNDGKVPLGPFSIEELKAHNPSADMPIWTEGMSEWTTLKNVPELHVLLPPVPPPIMSANKDKVTSLPNNIVLEPAIENQTVLKNPKKENDSSLPIEPSLVDKPKIKENPVKPTAQNINNLTPQKKSGMSRKTFYGILLTVLILAVIALYVASKLMYGTSVTNGPEDSSSVAMDSLAQAKQSLDNQQKQLDSTKIALAQAQQMHDDSMKNAAMAQERVDSSYRKNWKKYIAISKTFNSDDFWGGISNVQVSVMNGLPYMVDLIELKIQYVKKNGEIYDERTISQTKIAPNNQITMDAPDSDRGVNVDVVISKIISSDLNLNYSL